MGIDVISGGCGFIGSHLAEALVKKNRHIHIIDLNHPQPKDIRQPLSSNFPEIDTIYHLAALADIVPSIENPRDYFETNVTGTLNMLEFARANGCKKFIYAASASCYGDNPLQPTSEILPYNPKYPYALTKCLGEQLVAHYAQIYKLPAISMRLFNVYGTRSRTNGTYGAMFGTFLAQLANNKPITIVGDGEQQRDFIHVSDVVKAFIKAAKSGKNGIYNVGSGKPVSINHIANILGSKERIHIPKRPGEPDITCADISRIKQDLNWQPEINMEDGIKELLDNINYWKDSTVWTAETIQNATKSWFLCLA